MLTDILKPLQKSCGGNFLTNCSIIINFHVSKAGSSPTERQHKYDDGSARIRKQNSKKTVRVYDGKGKCLATKKNLFSESEDKEGILLLFICFLNPNFDPVPTVLGVK